jgi:cell division protein FtsB
MPAPVRAARQAPGPRSGARRTTVATAPRAVGATALATVSPLRRGAPSRPDLAVVREQARARATVRQRRLRAAIVAGGVLAGLLLFALAAFHAVLVGNQVRIDDLEARVADAQARYAASRLEVAELEAPDRIVAEATQRLGMVTPPDVTYLAPSGAVVPPEPAPAPEAGAGDGQAASSWSMVKPYLGSRP